MKVKFLPLIGATCLILMFIGKAIPTKAHEEPQQVHTFRESADKVIEYEIIYLDHDVSENEPKISEEDRELLARLVMAEGGILPMDGKQAVAQTVLNRVASDLFPDTISDVIYEVRYGVPQFSAVPKLYAEEPTWECYYAVDGAVEYPEAFPTDMYYFRTGEYHDFAEDYCQIGNTFFSTEE